jgi:hypothetical protein
VDEEEAASTGAALLLNVALRSLARGLVGGDGSSNDGSAGSRKFGWREERTKSAKWREIWQEGRETHQRRRRFEASSCDALRE